MPNIVERRKATQTALRLTESERSYLAAVSRVVAEDEPRATSARVVGAALRELCGWSRKRLLTAYRRHEAALLAERAVNEMEER